MTEPNGSTATYVYDADGELTDTTDEDGRRTTYSYNADGDLTGETWVSSSGGALDVITYSYDADNELTGVTDKYATLTFTYDSGGNQISTATSGPGAGQPSVTLTSTFNPQHSLTSITDNLSSVGITTYAYDAAIGQYYDRARYYTPTLGRFVSPDPLMFGGGGPNIYLYCENSPPNATDPAGLMPQAAQKRLEAIARAEAAIKEAMRRLGALRELMTKRQKEFYDTLKTMYGNKQIESVDDRVQEFPNTFNGAVANKILIWIPEKFTVDINKLMLTLMHESWHVMINSPMTSVEEELNAHQWELEFYALMKRQGTAIKDYDEEIKTWNQDSYIKAIMTARPKYPATSPGYGARLQKIGGLPADPSKLNNQPNQAPK